MCDESDQNTAFQKQILHLSADEPAIGRHAELRHFHLAVGGENNGFYVGTHRVLHRTYILNDFVCRYVLRCHGIGEACFFQQKPEFHTIDLRHHMFHALLFCKHGNDDIFLIVVRQGHEAVHSIQILRKQCGLIRAISAYDRDVRKTEGVIECLVQVLFDDFYRNVHIQEPGGEIGRNA